MMLPTWPGRTAADSSSDSNTGGSRRPTTSGSGGGVQVRNAYEQLGTARPEFEARGKHDAEGALNLGQ
jgi:hypothetical protein